MSVKCIDHKIVSRIKAHKYEFSCSNKHWKDWISISSSEIFVYIYEMKYFNYLHNLRFVLYNYLHNLRFVIFMTFRSLYTLGFLKWLEYRSEPFISSTRVECANSTCRASSCCLSYLPLTELSNFLFMTTVTRYWIHNTLSQITGSNTSFYPLGYLCMRTTVRTK